MALFLLYEFIGCFKVPMIKWLGLTKLSYLW